MIVDETVDWLRDRPYYQDQFAHERVVPGRSPVYADCAIDDRLASALADQGIEQLFRHQQTAIEAIRRGDNAILATQTASGKSLAYTVPAIERALADRATTLYIAPQVALINDQADALSELADSLGFASGVRVARYTGQQSRQTKEAVRDRQPTLLMVTPDMLHYGILPHAHRLWDWFFERLRTVVVDEIHEYRGVFGSHVALVMRRLNRVAQRFGADPEYVCCSATIGNPVEHAATITGRDPETFVAVDTDTSATGPTHWVCWNPPEYTDSRGLNRRRSSHQETKQLFVDLVERGNQTVAFANSRQACERYATESADALRERGEHDLATSVGAYQAALPDDRRESIEETLQSGDLRGVWSTSALELGVDIGGLDVVILDGYPGTRMNTFQRAGRAGRGTDASLVILVAGEDQLDQYVMRNPSTLFEDDPERAVTNPENETLLPGHVTCGARETWLAPDDDAHFGPKLPEIVADLTAAGDLERRETEQGIRWPYVGGGSPQHDLQLRSAGDREIHLRTREGDKLGTLGFGDALRDAHPGAIYHHQGATYEVTDLDLDADVATLDRTWAEYYTQVKHEKTITIEADRRETAFAAMPSVPVRLADITMRKQITGFERRDPRSGETLGEQALNLPETTLETTALYYVLPQAFEERLRSRSGDFDGGIHAAEHAMIAMFPWEFLCDRRDIGGLSTPHHPQTDRSTVFIYDGHPGGVGLTRAGYESIDDLASVTLDLVAGCDCESGCPACVQSPHCGNGNEPLDKSVATALLGAVTGEV